MRGAACTEGPLAAAARPGRGGDPAAASHGTLTGTTMVRRLLQPFDYPSRPPWLPQEVVGTSV